MTLMQVVADDTMPVPGFERRTFRCSTCDDVETHRAFVKPGREGDAEPVPVHASASAADPNQELPALRVDGAPSIVGGQADGDRPASLLEWASALDGAQREDGAALPVMDAAPGIAPAAAAPAPSPFTSTLLRRVAAKLRGGTMFSRV
ncbi:MAG TPA: hypothetical protein VGF60_05295 [Xanthobacteraceae bacterium]